MKGTTALSTFGVTAVVIGIVVGLGLRTGAQDFVEPSPHHTEANFPVVGILKAETARLHIVNLSMNTTELSHRFLFMFIDPRGVLIMPEQVCEVRAGETCSSNLTGAECAPQGGLQRCEFRALVVPDPAACRPGIPADGGVQDVDETRWSTNIEIIGPTGVARFTAGPNTVMKVPAGICPPGGTDGGGFFDGGGAADGGGFFDGGGVADGGGFFDGGGVADGGGFFDGVTNGFAIP